MQVVALSLMGHQVVIESAETTLDADVHQRKDSKSRIHTERSIEGSSMQSLYANSVRQTEAVSSSLPKVTSEQTKN